MAAIPEIHLLFSRRGISKVGQPLCIPHEAWLFDIGTAVIDIVTPEGSIQEKEHRDAIQKSMPHVEREQELIAIDPIETKNELILAERIDPTFETDDRLSLRIDQALLAGVSGNSPDFRLEVDATHYLLNDLVINALRSDTKVVRLID